MDDAHLPLPFYSEFSSLGPDDTKALVGTSPYTGDVQQTGLRIPAAPSTIDNRYLFRLAGYRVGASHVRLVGIRQYLSIGTLVEDRSQGCSYAIEHEIKAPMWSFQDGNVSWHVRVSPLQKVMDIPGPPIPTPQGTTPLTFESTTPALLFAGAAPEPYTAPAGVPGLELAGQLDTFYDLRFPWRASNAHTYSLHYDIEGPADVVFYASVKQTDLNGRCRLVVPGVSIDQIAIVNPEDAFLLVFPTAIYWRIAGALVFDETGPTKLKGRGTT